MLSKAAWSRLKGLSRKKNREEAGLFLAEGVRLVEELLASSVVPVTAVVSPSLEDSVRGAALARALRARVETHDVSDHDLADLAGTDSPQGVVVAAEIPVATLAEWAPAPRATVLALDAVQDPGNFGTIVRSAEAFGVSMVAVLPGTVDPWNPKAVRSAMGSSLRLPIVETDIAALAAAAGAAGFAICAADMGGDDVTATALPPRVLLVLGNEGAGIGDAVRAVCDRTLSIPLRGAVESLNVGVAAGIMLYELSRRG